MTDWTPDELTVIDAEDEVRLASYRLDGSRRPFVTMWIVQVDGDVVVRSARQVNPWFRRAVASGTGRVSIGAIDRDVSFEHVELDGEAIDTAYHRKYDRYGARIVGGVVGTDSYARTLRLTPLNRKA